MTEKHIVYHIPVCPFSQRLKILLAIRGMEDLIDFRVVDITKPRAPDLLAKTRGTTSLPILETPDGRIVKESLVILRYLDESLPGTPLRRSCPMEHALESMLIAKEGPFTTAGYLFVLNQSLQDREAHLQKTLAIYRDINDFLVEHGPNGPFLFDEFGLAEAVYAPVFQRFWFLDYYEGFTFPKDGNYDRVRQWHDSCIAHPMAGQVSKDEIIKLYYDYALGAGNGALVKGRSFSSFVFEPDWKDRPMPPKDKYAPSASDKDLGLLT